MLLLLFVLWRLLVLFFEPVSSESSFHCHFDNDFRPLLALLEVDLRIASHVLPVATCSPRVGLGERSPLSDLPVFLDGDDGGSLGKSDLFFAALPPLVDCRVILFGPCGSLADLSGPPHSPPRGFLRGSSAGLSGPPR